jgi:hypothetical protein
LSPRRISEIVSAEVADLAGAEFMARLELAVERHRPITPEAAAAFAEGPEVSGGIDADPDDE